MKVIFAEKYLEQLVKVILYENPFNNRLRYLFVEASLEKLVRVTCCEKLPSPIGEGNVLTRFFLGSRSLCALRKSTQSCVFE